MDDLNLLKERKNLEENYRENLKQLRKISAFLKNIAKVHQYKSKLYEKLFKENENLVDTKSQNPVITIFTTSIQNIYDSFHIYEKASHKLVSTIENDIIKPLDDYIQSQVNIYNLNLKQLKNIATDYTSNKNILEKYKKKYYCSSYISSQINSKDINNLIIRGDNSALDDIIKKKMRQKNDEFLYKYELVKYNKNISELNKNYNEFSQNIVDLENARVHFVSSLTDKCGKIVDELQQLKAIFLNDVKKFSSKEICEEERKYQTKECIKFRTNTSTSRIPLQNFISYQKLDEKTITEIEKEISQPKNEDEEHPLNNSITPINMEENEQISFINDVINILLSENDIQQEKIATLLELMEQKGFLFAKKVLNCLYEKQGVTSIKFLNLQNLEHLGNILSYITLREYSIFSGHFELNFKIILIAEKIFYQKKSNNDKVYLCALLSKNKYYRTKEFWRNVLELKLANTLKDHIQRINKHKLPDDGKKSIFGKLGNAIFNNSYKNSLISKSRILPLLTDFNEMSSDKIEIIDRMASEEMIKIIRESIPSFANYNFPSEQCLDLIAQLTVDYRIDKKYIKFFVTYYNVSGYTIRKLVPNEKGNIINIFNQFKEVTGINKKIKLMKNVIPFLTFKDYINLFLCSKLFYTKLRKKVFKYILQQKNLPKKIRLLIWGNLLNIRQLKQQYNYQEILKNTKDEKCRYEINLDVVRTTVGNVSDPEKTREKITNVLYTVAQLNNGIKYCQGMNFIVQFLFEIYGEEEAFYIFLSFFKNTEYSTIYAKDLEKLKVFFYIFKRILSLLEPELSSYFKSNGVDVNFFLSPWFLTLFTSSHQNFKGELDNSQILIRILDNFIVSGWKSTMEVGCVALHSYENTLMSKRYEDMMQFLINDMLRSEFFSKNNQDFIENFFTETKISKKLIKNIEEEFNQKIALDLDSNENDKKRKK